MREDTLAVWLECPHGAVHLHGPGAADSLSYTSTTVTSTTQVATQAGCQTLCDSGAGADGDDYADAGPTCCLSQIPDDAWMGSYGEHCRKYDDDISFRDYKRLRLKARHNKLLGTTTTPLKIKLSIGPPAGVRGRRITVSAILDTGASPP